MLEHGLTCGTERPCCLNPAGLRASRWPEHSEPCQAGKDVPPRKAVMQHHRPNGEGTRSPGGAERANSGAVPTFPGEPGEAPLYAAAHRHGRAKVADVTSRRKVTSSSRVRSVTGSLGPPCSSQASAARVARKRRPRAPASSWSGAVWAGVPGGSAGRGGAATAATPPPSGDWTCAAPAPWARVAAAGSVSPLEAAVGAGPESRVCALPTGTPPAAARVVGPLEEDPGHAGIATEAG